MVERKMISNRVPVELVAKIARESYRRRAHKTDIVIEALDDYFRKPVTERPVKALAE